MIKKLLYSLLIILCSYTLSYTGYYDLEIIQPQPSLTTTNRWYKAYPGIEFNARVAVIGGAYPYAFALTTYPTGMTINSSTGVITWSNPTESGSPYSVTVSVTDSENNTQTRSWTITVTTTGFYFLDALNGKTVANGGTGTLANPWKVMADFYSGSKTDSTYSDGFLYFRGGTYAVSSCNVFENNDDGTHRIPFVVYYKPVVWLAYPGDSQPVIDNESDYSIIFYAGTDNVYLDGLKFINSKGYGVQTESDGNRQTYHRLFFDGLAATPGANNQSFIRVLNNGVGNYMTIQDCTFQDSAYGSGIKFYSVNKSLVEDCVFSNFTSSSSGEGIALKYAITRPTVRHNVLSGFYDRAINGNMNSSSSMEGDICFNYLHTATSNIMLINQDSQAGRIYFYRNTLRGRIQFNTTTSSNGPFYFYNNVIVNSDSGNKLYYDGEVDTERIIMGDNLTGTEATGILDSNGYLQGAYRTTYLGSVGYELTSSGFSSVTGCTISGASMQ